MALPINIENLIKGTTVEWERLEFKAGWQPEKVIRTMCAFANDLHNWGGGYIIIGIDEQEGKPILPPVGLNENSLDKIQKEIITLAHQIQPNYIPIIQPYVLENKNILVLWCPAGDRRMYTAPAILQFKKQSNGKQVQRHAYVRIGSQTLIAKDETLRQLQEISVRVPFDDQANNQATINDFDLGLILSYLQEIKSELYDEGLKIPLSDLARSMNIAKGPNEFLRPLNVGLLFFSQQPEKYFPCAWIEIVLHKDESGEQFEEHYFKGPLHTQLRNALSFIKTNIIGEKVVKVEDRAEADRFFNFPYRAIEEALANAVYHKSYEKREPIEVQIWHDKIEIVSFPGPVPSIEENDLKNNLRVTPREYRNRRIGDFLKELDLTEGRGTGFPAINRAMENNGSPKPIFKTNNERTYFLTILPVHPLTDENAQEVQGKFQKPKKSQRELSPRQQKIVDYVRENGSISNAVCQKLLNISRPTAARDLQKMVSQNLLKQRGLNRGAIYTLME
ncbi:MAG: putative DNA binding domain-containing protein [Bacteroidales bacterium]|nr:putative DNA binding domain-containing protein [Bacteroidales bacterium]